MKPAIYYAIRRNMHHTIIAVTSEKFRTWHGRNVQDNSATHGRCSDLMGRFETQEAADLKKSELIRIVADYAAKREPLEEKIRNLYRAERSAIDAALQK